MTRPNTTTAAYSYDANGAMSSLTDLGKFTNYGHTNESLLSSTSTGSQTFGYDAAKRLTQVGTGNPYRYDAADNLTQMTVGGGAPLAQAFDVANQLASVAQGTGSQRTFSYDPKGNRTSALDAQKNHTTYTYDQANELINYTGPAPTSTSAQYTYDGDGLRQTKTVSSLLSNETYDVSGSLPLMIEDGPTAYITGPGGLPLEQISPGGTVRYYSHDQLGSTTTLTNQSGATLATYTYDAYGNPTGSPPAVRQPFGYAGQYTDAETGLQYLRARYYDPTTGQFLSRDPLASQTRQPYAYTSGSPLNATDPGGLDNWLDLGLPSPGQVGTRAYQGAVGEADGLSSTLTFGVAKFSDVAGINTGCFGPAYAIGDGFGTGAAAVIPVDRLARGAIRVVRWARGIRATEETNGAGRTFVTTSRGTTFDIPGGYVGREAENGKGIVYQRPGAPENAGSIRIMEPTEQYPNGYFRYYNPRGQPLDVNGQPGSRGATHIPEDFTGQLPSWP